MTSQIQLDFANWLSPAEGPFLQEIYNQLQFSLPSSDTYRALRELQNKSKGKSQPYEPDPGPTGSPATPHHHHQRSLDAAHGYECTST